MTKPVRSSFTAVLRVWAAFIGTIFKRSARIRGVFLHDPAADRPKNLDNPFHDAGLRNASGTSLPAPLAAQNASHRDSFAALRWTLDLTRNLR
jgi:hypothetical protein